MDKEFEEQLLEHQMFLVRCKRGETLMMYFAPLLVGLMVAVVIRDINKHYLVGAALNGFSAVLWLFIHRINIRAYGRSCTLLGELDTIANLQHRANKELKESE
jgi:hypothetical protein